MKMKMGCDKMGYNKRLAAGLALAVVVLVAGCVWAEGWIEREGAHMIADILPIGEAVQRGEWALAGEQVGEVVEHWRGARRIWLGLLSHREVWNIDEALISLNVYLDMASAEDAMNQLAVLEYYLERAVEGDDLNWHNFF